MLHFFISKDLSSSFYPHFKSPSISSIQELRWYVYSIETYEGRFLICMEEATRYCLVFHELSDGDFLKFPNIVKDRLWREILTLAEEHRGNRKILSALKTDFLSQSYFSLGWDYAECSEIFTIAEDLKRLLDRLGGYPLPGCTEFSLSLQLNQIKRYSYVYQGSILPLHAFKTFWRKKFVAEARHCLSKRTPTPS